MKVVFSEEQIAKRVQEVAVDVSRDYGDEVVHAVCILESGFIFLADLVRRVTCPVVCHFMKMGWTDMVVGSQPIRNIAYDPITEVEGKNILLVDALVDSGITLDYLVQHLLLKKPKSLRTAALVDREDRRRLSFQVNYAGFSWAGDHLVGYGLAMDGLYRNLPYVAAIASVDMQRETEKEGAVTQ